MKKLTRRETRVPDPQPVWALSQQTPASPVSEPSWKLIRQSPAERQRMHEAEMSFPRPSPAPKVDVEVK